MVAMKIDRHASPQFGSARTVAIESPAPRAFSSATLDDVGASIGNVAHSADKASVAGGDGAALDVDGFVTEAEARRFHADFATRPSTQRAAALLVGMYAPATSVDVTLPKALAPIVRRHTLDFPDQAARLRELPEHLRAAAHVALDVANHVDNDHEGGVSRSRFNAEAVIDVDTITAALAPGNRELLREASNDMVATPKVVGQLEALREHITTASTTKDFVPKNPPEYVARLPLQKVKLELVTFGTLENRLPIGPAGRPGTTTITPPQSFDGGRVVMGGGVSHTPGTSQAYAVEVNRYFQLEAREGLTVVLKTETAGATVYGRRATRTSELVLDGKEVEQVEGNVRNVSLKKQDIIDLAGIAEGAPTTLLAYVFDGDKLVESAEFKLPANPIVEQVRHEGLPQAVTPPPLTPTSLTARKLLGVTVTVPALLAALESLPHGAPLNEDSARVLLAGLKNVAPADRAAAEATLRDLARNRDGQGTQWRAPDLGLSAFRERLAKAVPQPLTAAFSGPAALLVRELIGDERPVSAQTAQHLVGYLKRLCVDDEHLAVAAGGASAAVSIARDLLLFSPKELSPKAASALDGFLRFAEPQPHLASRVAVRLGLEDFMFDQPGAIVVAGGQHRRHDSMTLYTAVNVALPTRCLKGLLEAGVNGAPVTVASSDRFNVVARYEPAMRRFAFELQPAAGQPAVVVRAPSHISLAALPTERKLSFDIE
jgi:hypothetical protein